MDHERILTLESDPEGPEQLEALYRQGRTAFAETLPRALEERPQSVLLRAWAARLAPDVMDVRARTELCAVILLAVFAALYIKLPAYLPLDENWFYFFNATLGPLGALILYLLHVRGWPRRATAAMGALFGLLALYLNLLPENGSDKSALVAMHTPLLLWCAAAVAHAGELRPSVEARRAWIRFFGEMVVFSGLLALGGAVLTALTAGLFELINAPVDWIGKWMVPMGISAIPVVAAWAVSRGAAGARVMPLLARIFAPLFLVVLTGYLLQLSLHLGELFDDREVLLMFNVLLLCVVGLCVFSLSGQGAAASRWLHRLLAVLALLAVAFDGIGLAAIAGRIMDMGLTPNRLAVLGANLAVLGNLLLLLRGFRRIFAGAALPAELERVTAGYLPVYAAWTVFVVLAFPALF